jgi:hypothetical protein
MSIIVSFDLLLRKPEGNTKSFYGETIYNYFKHFLVPFGDLNILFETEMFPFAKEFYFPVI